MGFGNKCFILDHPRNRSFTDQEIHRIRQINEVKDLNYIPGGTSILIYPVLWEHSGKTLDQVKSMILEVLD